MRLPSYADGNSLALFRSTSINFFAELLKKRPDAFTMGSSLISIVLLSVFVYGIIEEGDGKLSSGKKLIKYNSELIHDLPPWAQELATKYCTETVNLYFVHGNIRDFLPHNHRASAHFVFVKIWDYIS